MFRKVLIANRGEIALRILRTCRELGVPAAVVYSDVDAAAPHVRAADEAWRVGPADPRESYLSIPALLAAAAAAGADALHPGYGFLSERPELAEACLAASITFIGPPPAATRLLGDKIAARELAQRCRVPVVPGCAFGARGMGPSRRAEAPASGTCGAPWPRQVDPALSTQYLDAATRLRFPLLVKAAAGGGGRGMRVVAAAGALPSALAAAQREADAAFGDGRLLLEELVTPARHVEVQLLADRFGTVVAVGDRDCSSQRRHQKILEEAPAPDLPPSLRRRLHRAAMRLAAAAGYEGAGTVEFLVPLDEFGRPNGGFFFLELNARLQVEHTVTEMVTGLDLVACQLHVAAGAALAGSRHPRADTAGQGPGRGGQQSGAQALRRTSVIAPRGHAIQARIYAEDPRRGFLPAAGALALIRWPAGPGVRVDAAVGEADSGYQVPSEYDALLAKVVCWAEERPAAVRRLERALEETVVLGVPTTTAFLRRLISHPAFVHGPSDTGFVERSVRGEGTAAETAACSTQNAAESALPAGYRLLPSHSQPPFAVLCAAAAALFSESPGSVVAGGRAPPAGPWQRLRGWATGGAVRELRLAYAGLGQAARPAYGWGGSEQCLATLALAAASGARHGYRVTVGEQSATVTWQVLPEPGGRAARVVLFFGPHQDGPRIAVWLAPSAPGTMAATGAAGAARGWELLDPEDGERWLVWPDVPAPRPPLPGPLAPSDVASLGEGPAAPPARARIAAGHWLLAAPLPGRVAQVCVAEGETVTVDAPLVVLEAMKIEHALSAGRAARVVRVVARSGVLVRAGQPLMELASVEDEGS